MLQHPFNYSGLLVACVGKCSPQPIKVLLSGLPNWRIIRVANIRQNALLGGIDMPALIINPGDGYFIADIFGFILAVPMALFLAFWMSSVKRRGVVVVGAFLGALIGFLII